MFLPINPVSRDFGEGCGAQGLYGSDGSIVSITIVSHVVVEGAELFYTE
jgi:hypothetical protein